MIRILSFEKLENPEIYFFAIEGICKLALSFLEINPSETESVIIIYIILGWMGVCDVCVCLSLCVCVMALCVMVVCV